MLSLCMTSLHVVKYLSVQQSLVSLSLEKEIGVLLMAGEQRNILVYCKIIHWITLRLFVCVNIDMSSLFVFLDYLILKYL